MADKRKGRQRKVEEEEKPSKEEYAVAKYLRFGLPVKEGKMHGMEVKCFFGNAAVDKLLESKWSSSKNQKDPLFTNRITCVTYLARLLEKGLFHRAERDKRKKDKDKDKPKKKRKDGEKEEVPAIEDSSPRARKNKKDKKGKKDKESEVAAEDESTKKGEKDEDKEKKDEKKKKERRLKLVMPEEQYFEDSDEVYVWIYDPVNAKTFFIGLLMVLGAIALCMFPLWPAEVRIGVYYLSLAAASFVGFILFLVVVRLILFCLIWGLTLGRHHFWLLPNLTEDVGFFDSFRPLYKHDKVTGDSKAGDSGVKRGKKKAGKEIEDSPGDGVQSENTGSNKDKSSDKDDSDEFEVIKKEDLDENGDEDEKDKEEEEEEEEDEVRREEDNGEDMEEDNADDEDEEMNDEDEEENGEMDEDEEEEEEEEEEEDEMRDSEENDTKSKENKKTK